MNSDLNMKKIMLKYWWALIVALLTFAVIFDVLIFTSYDILLTIVLGIMLLLCVGIVISWVLLIKNKKWRESIVSFICSMVIIIAFTFISAIMALYGPLTDNFGKNHSIPEGQDYSIPYEMEFRQMESADSLNIDSYLQIQNDIQGGMYLYDFYYGALPAGEIYLKCYEVAENLPLSEERILEASKVSIEHSTSFKQLVSRQRFTIFEGEWGDYYAARIEVWHRDADTQQEQKLYEKVYRVEGWMR